LGRALDSSPTLSSPNPWQVATNPTTVWRLQIDTLLPLCIIGIIRTAHPDSTVENTAIRWSFRHYRSASLNTTPHVAIRLAQYTRPRVSIGIKRLLTQSFYSSYTVAFRSHERRENDCSSHIGQRLPHGSAIDYVFCNRGIDCSQLQHDPDYHHS
jgi:hypothetical protein